MLQQSLNHSSETATKTHPPRAIEPQTSQTTTPINFRLLHWGAAAQSVVDCFNPLDIVDWAATLKKSG